MAKITPFLFSWQDINSKSDLDRLKLVLDTIPDESLMNRMESYRGKGRNDYPVRVMWNVLLAGIVYQHPSIESLRRELMRNAELRMICGFDPACGSDAVPSSPAFTHFLKTLCRFEAYIKTMFDQLVEEAGSYLPDLGERLAFDGKAISSAGKPAKKASPDGRRDTDANWGKHEYKGIDQKGNLWTKVKRWFGYKLHLLVDTTYELPMAFSITRASAPEGKQVIPLLEDHIQSHQTVGARRDVLTADRGLDDHKLIEALYDGYQVKPVIDIRNCWKTEGDEIERIPGQPATRQLYEYDADTIMYDYRGNIYCYCTVTHAHQLMAFKGYEKKRRTLKYLCPVKAWDMTCHCQSECPHFMKSIRIPIARNRRLFTPIARSSYKWEREYANRTAVERVNSRVDVSYGFERHFIRGLSKMHMRLSLAMIVMLAMAVGHIKAGRKEMMRSLIKQAPPAAKAA
jgi:hypothetical protein